VNPTGRRRRGRVALPALAAGVLLALSLPPWGFWPLGLVGAGLLFWRLAGLRLRGRLWAGWVAGLGCDALGLMWARAFNWYGAVVLILLEALFFAAAAGLTPPFRGRAPAFVAAATLAEAVRMTWPFGGLPIGGVFLGQADGPLLQLARIGGPLLLTAGVWAGGVGLATLAAGLPLERPRRRRPPPALPLPPPARNRLLGRSAFVLVGLGLLVLLGALVPDGGAPVRTIRVALVQGGGRRGVNQEQVSPSTVFAAQVAEMRALPPAPSPALVLWPEDVVALSGPLRGSTQGALLSQLARRRRTTLIAGVTEPASPGTFRNEIVAWAPNGRIVATFEKVHRVPFGEYVPYRSFISHLADLSEVPTDAVPGHGTGLLRTPAGPLGTLVSFEVFYANRSRTSVRAGAQLLIVPTNTSSYAAAQIPTQEVAADAIQAVETGRDLVQSAPTGYSTVVDQRGRVLQRSVLGRPQVLSATVALRRGFTPYDHLGDLPVLLLSAGALVLGWARQRKRRSTPHS
jgi:apolipoprotein N-acyltransferase